MSGTTYDITINPKDEVLKLFLSKFDSELKGLEKKINDKMNIDLSKQGKKSAFSFSDAFKASLLGNLGANLITNLFSNIGSVGKSFFEASSQMENFRISFNTFLGDAEKGGEFLASIYDFAAKTPFETAGLAQASQTLLGYGVATEQVLPTIKTLGDISQGNGEKLKLLSLAFGQVVGAGRLMGGELRQMVENGFNPLENIMKRTGETTAEVKKRMEDGGVSVQEVARAMEDATTGMGRFANGMEKQSQTVSGRLSTLRDQFKEIGMAILGVTTSGEITKGGLFDQISEGINKLASVLSSVDWFAIGTVIGGTLKFITDNFGLLASVLAGGVIGYAIFGISTALIGLSTAITTAGGAMLFFQTAIAPILATALPIIGVVLALAGVAGILYIAWQNNFLGIQDTTFNVLKNIGTWISTTGIEWLTMIGSFLKGMIIPINNTLMFLQQAILPFLGVIGGAIAEFFAAQIQGTSLFLGSLVTAIGSGFTVILNLSYPFLKSLLELTINTGVGIYGAFEQLFGTLGALFSGDGKQVLLGLARMFISISGIGMQVVKGTVKFVESGINKLIDMINAFIANPIVQEALKQMGINATKISHVNFADGLASSLDASFQGLLSSLDQSDALGGFATKQEKLKSDLTNSLMLPLEAVKDFANNTDFQGMGATITSGGESVANGIRSVARTVNTAIAKNALNPFQMDAGAVANQIDVGINALKAGAVKLDKALQNVGNKTNSGKEKSDTNTTVEELVKKQMGSFDPNSFSGATKNKDSKSKSGGGQSQAEKNAKDAEKFALEMAQNDEQLARQKEELRIQQITDEKEREKEMLKFKAKNQIDDLAGVNATEQQKASLIKEINNKLQQDLLSVDKGFADKKLKEEEKRIAEEKRKREQLANEQEKREREKEKRLEEQKKISAEIAKNNLDLAKETEELRIQQITDEKEREKEMLKFKAKNQIEEINKINATSGQKTALIEEINKKLASDLAKIESNNLLDKISSITNPVDIKPLNLTLASQTASSQFIPNNTTTSGGQTPFIGTAVFNNNEGFEAVQQQYNIQNFQF